MADRGDAKGQFLLGVLNYQGRGAEQDYAEAAKWYLKAAEQGESDAQRYIGMMYAEGQGVAKDDKEAFKLSRKAADRGESVAQFNLGVMYYEGKCITQDYIQAYMWASLASSYAPPKSLKDMAAAKMSSYQIEEAQRLARGKAEDIDRLKATRGN
ncbi:MAG: sel1 repeat family protein [Candidatus Riflebacteria bacterium]|nr:sel1 repeat family protein [Candidatus Riflebacteria bacterium]